MLTLIFIALIAVPLGFAAGLGATVGYIAGACRATDHEPRWRGQ